MEAAGAVASLFAIIGFTLQSTKSIYEITKGIRDGPATLDKLTFAVKELETILDQLRILALNSRATQQLTERAIWERLEKHVVRCLDDVLNLKRTIEALDVASAGRTAVKVWKRIKTSLKDRDFEKMYYTMQHHVVLFGLQLSIIEIQRNTVRETNSMRRDNAVSDSLHNCLSQIQLNSDGIKAHVTEHMNHVRSSIKNLDISTFEAYQKELTKFLNHRNQRNGYSLLHDAAQHDRLDITQLVLEHGADATTMDVIFILLHYAKEQCDQARLLRFVDRKHNSGKTVLMAAAESNQPENMRLLLEYGADWSLTDNNGCNALHYCAFRGYKLCVEILLQHASGIDSKDPMKPSPMGQQKFKALLNQQSNDDRLTPLHDATAGGHQDIIRILLNTYHADYEIYDRHSDSILHRAIQANHDEVLIPCLEHMAQNRDQAKFMRVLHHRNTSTYRTVLEAAECRGRKEWADLLKRYGA